MKNLILISLGLMLSIVCNNVYSQINYDEGTIWHYGFSTWGLPVSHSYISLTIDGDTLINEQPFQRIVKSSNWNKWDIQTPFPVEYIKREDDKVFWFNQQNGTVSILYDFAAEQGDSWIISINDCELLVVVDSVSYSEYYGVLKKNLFVTDYFTWEDHNYTGDCFKGKIIEDIGHTITFFPQYAYYLCEGLHIDGVLPEGIRCYEDISFHYNFKGYPCDTAWYWIGVDDYEIINTKIYPNPVTGVITIEVADNIDIVITDIIGRVITEKRNCDNKNDFDTSKWNMGIYFVNLYSGGVKIKTEKFFKN